MIPLRAFYSDVHGCYDEMVALHSILNSIFPKIEHWHLGDLIDRGPESGKCVQFAKEHFHGGVLGNHENSMIKLWERFKNDFSQCRNIDKRKTLSQLDQELINYLKELPYLHVFDDINTVICHGGLYPEIPLYKQTEMHSTLNNQMILRDKSKWNFSENRWWGSDASNQPKTNKSEEESVNEGYARWYELYDHKENCIYGHSVLGLTPYIHKNENAGITIGIDTGSCFGGYITAYIMPIHKFVRIKCKEYVIGKNVKNFKLKEQNGKLN